MWDWATVSPSGVWSSGRPWEHEHFGGRGLAPLRGTAHAMFFPHTPTSSFSLLLKPALIDQIQSDPIKSVLENISGYIAVSLLEVAFMASVSVERSGFSGEAGPAGHTYIGVRSFFYRNRLVQRWRGPQMHRLPGGEPGKLVVRCGLCPRAGEAGAQMSEGSRWVLQLR